MTALMLHGALILLLAGILSWGLGVLIRAVIDCHRRGMARVHAGTSWAARGCSCDLSLLDGLDGLRCSCQREAA